MRGIRLECQAESLVDWNSFPGSVVHGVLGERLRTLSCIYPGRTCQECPLHSQCAYGHLFASVRPESAERMRKYGEVPSPCRLAIFPWDHSVTRQGDGISVEIALFGRATEWLPVVVEATIQGLEKGVGRRVNGTARGQFRVVSALDLFSERAWAFEPDVDRPRLDPVVFQVPASCADSCRFPQALRWRTPVRLVAGGKVCGRPDFRALMSSLLRRLSNLLYFHEGITLDLDFKGLVEAASVAPVTAQWVRAGMRRYSARQRQAMRLDGLVGTLLLDEATKPFLPLLVIGQHLGVGKNTTLGMGLYTLEEVDSAS